MTAPLPSGRDADRTPTSPGTPRHRFRGPVTYVQPGSYEATAEPGRVLATLLGSCVSACICDPVARIGGLNHFLLPGDATSGSNDPGARTRYGVFAMEQLINALLKLGAERAQLEAKLFGGANVIAMSADQSVGDRNQSFAIAFMRREGIPITASELGGTQSRRILFQPSLNKVFVRTGGEAEHVELHRKERDLAKRTPALAHGGEVELF